MEPAVLWVVLIALGVFVLGLVGGWYLGRRARASSAAASTLIRGTTTPGVTSPVESSGSEPSPETAAQGAAARTPADTTDAEVSGHRLEPAASATGGTPGAPASGAVGADIPTPARLERDERARYAEIIGIETENASLRAVAARVPGLERRIRELEVVIEEHTGPSGPLIDLTGSDPVVGNDDTDVTSG